MLVPELFAVLAGVLAAGALSFRATASPLGSLAPKGSVDSGEPLAAIRRRVLLCLESLGSARLLAGIRESPRLRTLVSESGIAVTPEQMAALKAVSAGSAVILLPLGKPGLVAMPLMGLAWFRLPDFFLGRAQGKRRRGLNAEIPQLLDVLAAGTSAGLSAQMALQRSVPAIRDPLAGELRDLLDAVSLGGRWRTELAGLSSRIDLPDLRRAVNAITRTEVLGVSLADTLRDLAADVRAARRAAATEKARKAPVKMLFPLVFMILPAFLLLTVVPVLLSTLRSIG